MEATESNETLHQIKTERFNKVKRKLTKDYVKKIVQQNIREPKETLEITSVIISYALAEVLDEEGKKELAVKLRHADHQPDLEQALYHTDRKALHQHIVPQLKKLSENKEINQGKGDRNYQGKLIPKYWRRDTAQPSADANEKARIEKIMHESELRSRIFTIVRATVSKEYVKDIIQAHVHAPMEQEKLIGFVLKKALENAATDSYIKALAEKKGVHEHITDPNLALYKYDRDWINPVIRDHIRKLGKSEINVKPDHSFKYRPKTAYWRKESAEPKK